MYWQIASNGSFEALENVCRRKTPPAARRHRHFLHGEVLRIGKIASNGSFEALEKCLSAQNASCRARGTAIFAWEVLRIGKIASNGSFEALEKMSVGAKRLLPRRHRHFAWGGFAYWQNRFKRVV